MFKKARQFALSENANYQETQLHYHAINNQLRLDLSHRKRRLLSSLYSTREDEFSKMKCVVSATAKQSKQILNVSIISTSFLK